MTGPDVKVPKNIFYFEVLLYLSLLIDALSAAFLDRMPDNVTESTKLAVNFIVIAMTLGFVQLVWLAAHRRKNWARMILLVALMLSVASIVTTVGETGLQFSTFVDVISTALTALGLSFSFTGDAQNWFRQPE
jgi:membrane-associated HD superfamily phosphohydrolase